MKRLLLSLVLAAVAVAAVLAWDVSRFFDRPLAHDEARVVTVEPGTPLARLAADLRRDGVFAGRREARYFTVYARLRGEAQAIKSGEYEIPPGMYPGELLAMLVAGRTRQYRLTVVEGGTFAELRQALARHEAIDIRLAEADGAAVMKAIGAEGEHPEGRFLPDTYHFPRGTTDIEFLRRAHRAMREALDRVWAGRSEGLPFDTAYEALILASIIEKETAVPKERRRIAGVFVRRLRRDMRLQTDPTVIYGIEDFDGDLRRRDLRSDTPYNTYTRRGLPPTPIALPGTASLEAAVDPAEGDALYFVSRGDGSHVFSATLEEHNRAVRRYQLGQTE